MFVLFSQCFGTESRFSVSPSQPKVGFSFETESRIFVFFRFQGKKEKEKKTTNRRLFCRRLSEQKFHLRAGLVLAHVLRGMLFTRR